MKALVAASLTALAIGTMTVPAAQAQDVGAAIARGAIRGALGVDRPYSRDGYYEGRSGYEDCRTVTVTRDGPYGPESRTRRVCD